MSIHEVIQEWAAKPFAYGQDCCQFAGAVTEELTGHNPMSRFSYATEEEAAEIIASYGGLDKAMRAVLGETVSDIQDGDVLLADKGYLIAGVAYKGRCVVKTKDGVTDWPLDCVREAWRCHKQS